MTTAQRGTLAAAILGSAIVFLDGTLVILALPRIGAQLDSTLIGQLEGQTYVTSGYLATLAAFLVLAGALGDYYGRRRMFRIGLVGFGLTSVALRAGAEPRAPRRRTVAPGPGRGAARAGLAVDHHEHLRGAGQGARVRRVGGGHVRARNARAADRRHPRRRRQAGGRCSSSTCRSLLIAFAATRFMDESRDESATGHFDWLGALVAILAVGGLAFGATRGQQRQWQDPIAFVALAIGAIALVAFPILMIRGKHPLVPLRLFAVRAFATINLSTLLIYGALYAGAGFQALFLQGVLGYSPLGAAIVGLPGGILLTLLSTRVGALSGRIGVRPFLVVGPLVMAAGSLWWLTVGSTSTPWTANLRDLGDARAPDRRAGRPAAGRGHLRHRDLPARGARSRPALMSSVPVRNAGIASAINNALSRVGQPLVAAAVFIAVSGTFYATLAAAVPGTDPSAPEVRRFEALNPPPADAPPELQAAARVASTDAYHVAVLVAAGLLVAGAGVNAVGLREGRRKQSGPGDPGPPLGS